jgi:hypothetical protein
MKRVFVLSPANCKGRRAQWLLRKSSRADLAVRLRGSGAALGEVFSFLSALYFRGKLAYAQAFARPPSACPGIFIITPDTGLVPHDVVIQAQQLRGYGRAPIHLKNRRYCSALERTAKRLEGEIGAECEVVLLGSLATGKYIDILTPVFQSCLRVPADFIGRGDMSRGGLLLRCVREHRELDYIDAAAVSAIANKRSRVNKPVARSLTCPTTIQKT